LDLLLSQRYRRWSIAVTTLVVTSGVLLSLARDRWSVQNFHVVEPGLIYRGAEQHAGPLRSIIRRYGIRTIVCLVDANPTERAIAQSLGIRWVWVPLGDSSLEATFQSLEEVAATLAASENQPVFYHCRRGVYRSNLAQGVYRMKSCGWTLEQTFRELRAVGFDPESNGGDRCCEEVLVQYYQERILARRDAGDQRMPLSAN
jgi:protein tyrosine phosphatase (PTP) superfamily phosphohydrolase (DUF442 family)